MQAGDGRRVDHVRRVSGQLGEPPLGRLERAGHQLGFRPVELDGEGELVAPGPAILSEQRGAGREVPERRGIGGGSLGTPARHQIELGDPLALVARRHERRPLVELVDDVEDLLFDVRGRRVLQEQSPDAEVHRRAFALGDERVGRLLYAIVRKAIGAVRSAAAGLPRTPRAAPPRDCARTRGRSVSASTLAPRQAASLRASCVSAGRSCSLPTISSTTLSV